MPYTSELRENENRIPLRLYGSDDLGEKVKIPPKNNIYQKETRRKEKNSEREKVREKPRSGRSTVKRRSAQGTVDSPGYTWLKLISLPGQEAELSYFFLFFFFLFFGALFDLGFKVWLTENFILLRNIYLLD